MAVSKIPSVTYIKNCKAHYYNSLFARAKKIRTAKFLIIDLYEASYNPIDRLFKIKDYEFRAVSIAGQLVSIEPHSEGFRLEVEDGTARITIHVKGVLNPSKQDSKENNTTWLENCPDDAADENKFVYELYLQGKKVFAKYPEVEYFATGDVVFVDGHLTEYEEARHIFPYNIGVIQEKTVEFRYNWFLECLSQFNSKTNCLNNTWREQYELK